MSSVLPTTLLSYEEYLEWESHQDERHEFVRGQVYLVTGAARRHHVIVTNLIWRLSERLQGTPCQVFAQGMKLRVESADAVFYPDVFVTCSSADRRREQALFEPRLIVEVLSPSTGGYDRTKKFAIYREIASLERYVLIDPRRRTIETFGRASAPPWQPVKVAEAGPIALPELGIELEPDELFRGLD